jgi:hypothetical protein
MKRAAASAMRVDIVSAKLIVTHRAGNCPPYEMLMQASNVQTKARSIKPNNIGNNRYGKN